MSAEDRMQLYLAGLVELEQQAHQGQFSAFQVALHSGDARRSTIGAQQQQLNATAIAAHEERLQWLQRNGYLQASQQRWDRTVNADSEDCLTLYSLTSKAIQEAP